MRPRFPHLREIVGPVVSIGGDAQVWVEDLGQAVQCIDDVAGWVTKRIPGRQQVAIVDTNGNIASRTDFNSKKVCYARRGGVLAGNNRVHFQTASSDMPGVAG